MSREWWNPPSEPPSTTASCPHEFVVTPACVAPRTRLHTATAHVPQPPLPGPYPDHVPSMPAGRPCPPPFVAAHCASCGVFISAYFAGISACTCVHIRLSLVSSNTSVCPRK